jgi:hypothetical protein
MKNIILYKPNTPEGYIEICRKINGKWEKRNKYFYYKMTLSSVFRLDDILSKMIKKDF